MIINRISQYQAYSAASQTVPKTKQVVMLYDGAIRFLQQAKEAIAEKRIQDRFNLLVKASDIIVGLQTCIDHENGGEIATILHDYYSSIDMRILYIHRTNSMEMCDRVIAELKEMRAAWHQIDNAAAGAALLPPDTTITYVDAPIAPNTLSGAATLPPQLSAGSDTVQVSA